MAGGQGYLNEIMLLNESRLLWGDVGPSGAFQKEKSLEGANCRNPRKSPYAPVANNILYCVFRRMDNEMEDPKGIQ